MEKKNSLEYYLKNWASIAGILSVFSIMLSAVYYYGFVNQLHISLLALPININDLIISSIFWLPQLIGISLAALIIEAVTLRFSNKSDYNNPFKTDADKMKHLKTFKWVSLLLLIIGALLYLLYIKTHVQNLFGFAVIMFTYSLIFLITGDIRITVKLNTAIAICLFFVPFIFNYIYFYGKTSAENALKSKTNYCIKSESSELCGKVLKHFNDFVLFKDDSGIQIIYLNTIDKITIE